MERHLYIVGWGGEFKIMSAISMDALWKRIKYRYGNGCIVTIEDDKTKKVYVR